MAETETVRRVIGPDECDILGHLNVARYFAVVSDGGFALQAMFGLDKANLTGGRRLSFAVVHADTTFHREVLAGEVVTLRSGVVEIGHRSALFRHRMVTLDGTLAFETMFRTVLMNLDSRRATAIPDDLRSAMAPYLADPE